MTASMSCARRRHEWSQIILRKLRQETPEAVSAERAAIARENESDNCGNAGKSDGAVWVNRDLPNADAPCMEANTAHFACQKCGKPYDWKPEFVGKVAKCA